MKWYAENGRMRAGQQLLDVAVLAWCYLFLRLGQSVQDTALRLREPGEQLQRAGENLAGGLGDAADRVAGAPLVGDRLRGPLDAAADASRAVAQAGITGQEAVDQLALVLGLLVALLPIAYVLSRWLPYRLRYAREAGAAGRLRGDVELLALRAATNAPLHRLARLGSEPVARWRRGEPGAAQALADLELRELGLTGRPVATRRRRLPQISDDDRQPGG